jgi:hypothetical protein
MPLALVLQVSVLFPCPVRPCGVGEPRPKGMVALEQRLNPSVMRLSSIRAWKTAHLAVRRATAKVPSSPLNGGTRLMRAAFFLGGAGWTVTNASTRIMENC